MLDTRIAGTGDEIVLEFFHRLLRAFGKCLDTAVLEIADVAADLMTSGRTLSEIAKSDALDLTADDKPPSHRHASKFQVSGFEFQVGGCKFQVAGFKFQVLRFRSMNLAFKLET